MNNFGILGIKKNILRKVKRQFKQQLICSLWWSASKVICEVFYWKFLAQRISTVIKKTEDRDQIISLENNQYLLSKPFVGHVNHFDLWLSPFEDVPLLEQILKNDKMWSLYNNVQHMRSEGKRNEPLVSLPKVRLNQGNGVMYTVGLEGSSLL